jgi:5-methyltetrahydrofolate--homocysteine methyltransferase
VPAEKFVDAVKDFNADALGMSALLSTTAPECEVVIKRLVEAGIRDKIKVMVGGGAMTAAFAEQMGADGYKATAPGAVELARQWVKG